MSHDGKRTFRFAIADGSNRLVDNQSVRAEDYEGALRLLRLGGFLEDEAGNALRAVPLNDESEDTE